MIPVRKVVSSLLVFAMMFTVARCYFVIPEQSGHSNFTYDSSSSRVETQQTDCGTGPEDLYVSYNDECRSINSRVAGGDDELKFLMVVI